MPSLVVPGHTYHKKQQTKFAVVRCGTTRRSSNSHNDLPAAKAYPFTGGVTNSSCRTDASRRCLGCLDDVFTCEPRRDCTSLQQNKIMLKILIAEAHRGNPLGVDSDAQEELHQYVEAHMVCPWDYWNTLRTFWRVGLFRPDISSEEIIDGLLEGAHFQAIFQEE